MRDGMYNRVEDITCILPSALQVILSDCSFLFIIIFYVEARVNGGSNYDSLKVAKCLVI